MTVTPLDTQLAIRVSADLAAALRADAAATGRTVAQSVRFHLAAALTPDDLDRAAELVQRATDLTVDVIEGLSEGAS